MDNSQRNLIVIAAILIVGILFVAVIGSFLLLPLITNRSTADVASTDPPLSMATEESPAAFDRDAQGQCAGYGKRPGVQDIAGDRYGRFGRDAGGVADG